jgi:hypothetical protein
VDAVASDVVARLRQAGVQAILLKGASFADWLYPDGVRVYVDVDLLVRSERVLAAEALLRELGYEQLWAPEDMPAQRPIASHWRRSDGGPPIDLHWAVPEAAAPPEVQWEELTRDRVQGEIEQLAEPARCVMAALHAARHAGLAKPAEDLSRAVQVAPREAWIAAADLAGRIGALDAFSAGLRTLPAGAALACAIGVRAPQTTRAVLLTQSPPPGADGLDALFTAGDARARARLIARTLVPTRRWMRSSTRLGRHGGLAWLVAAYVWHPVGVLARLPAAARAWVRAALFTRR